MSLYREGHMIEKELLIIGSGPAGLKAGEEAQKKGLDYLIIEKGEVAQSWRDIREDMIMLSPCMPQRDWTSISDNFPIWKMNVNYNLTIRATSINDVSLEEPFEYQIKFTPVKESDLDEIYQP